MRPYARKIYTVRGLILDGWFDTITDSGVAMLNSRFPYRYDFTRIQRNSVIRFDESRQKIVVGEYMGTFPVSMLDLVENSYYALASALADHIESRPLEPLAFTLATPEEVWDFVCKKSLPDRDTSTVINTAARRLHMLGFETAEDISHRHALVVVYDYGNAKIDVIVHKRTGKLLNIFSGDARTFNKLAAAENRDIISNLERVKELKELLKSEHKRQYIEMFESRRIPDGLALMDAEKRRNWEGGILQATIPAEQAIIDKYNEIHTSM